MDSICPLMQRILSLYIMINFSYANTIARRYNRCFVILVIVFPERLLRAHKERILAVFNSFIRITAASSDVCNFCQRSPLCLKCPPPVDTESQKRIAVIFILLFACCKLRCKFLRNLLCKLREIVKYPDNFALNRHRRNRYFYL